MNSTKSYLYLGGILLVIGLVLGVWMNQNSSSSNEIRTPEIRNGSHEDRSVTNKLEGPLGGEIIYDYVTTEYPEEGVIRSVGHLQNPIVDYETAEAIPLEQLKKWTAPKIFYGGNGEYRHVHFNSGIPQTYSLRSLAEKKMIEKYGLAIAGNGYPEDADKKELSERFLKASMKYWEIGGSVSLQEVSMTPVVVEVVGLGEPTAEDKDQSLIGQRIPMLLVVQSDPFSIAGEGVVIRTESKIDLTDPKDLYRRSWLLLPYVEQEYKGEMRLPPVSGYVVFDEPSMEAWEQMKDE